MGEKYKSLMDLDLPLSPMDTGTVRCALRFCAPFTLRFVRTNFKAHQTVSMSIESKRDPKPIRPTMCSISDASLMICNAYLARKF